MREERRQKERKQGLRASDREQEEMGRKNEEELREEKSRSKTRDTPLDLLVYFLIPILVLARHAIGMRINMSCLDGRNRHLVSSRRYVVGMCRLVPLPRKQLCW